MSELFCHAVDCNLPVYFVHGISRARILEWVAITSSREFSPTRDWNRVSCLGRQILYHWATKEDLCRNKDNNYFSLNWVFSIEVKPKEIIYIKDLKCLNFTSNSNIVLPWTPWGPGAPNLHIIENSSITFSQFSISWGSSYTKVPPHPQVHICGFN